MTRILILLCLLALPLRAQTTIEPPLFIPALLDVTAYNRAVETIQRKAGVADLNYQLLTYALPNRDTLYDSAAYFQGYAEGLREALTLVAMSIYFPILSPVPPTPTNPN